MRFRALLAALLLWMPSTARSADHLDLRYLWVMHSCRLCDLQGVNLNGSDLRGADLTLANLSGANLNGADLSGANLSSAHLPKADLSDTNLNGADLSDADLSGANLKDADLLKASLALSDLSGAELSGADLRGADLGGANLHRAVLSGQKIYIGHQGLVAQFDPADLREATLRKADLSEAQLSGIKLSGADLDEADLSGAYLRTADLSGVVLSGTNLGEAELTHTNLSRAVFEPRIDIPPNFSIRSATGLAEMLYRENPDALSALRKSFREAGRRDLERQVTRAIKHSERLQVGGLEAAFSYVLFEATTEWGNEPGRALLIMGALIVLLTLVYCRALDTDTGRAGIWQEYAKERIHQDIGTASPIRAGYRTIGGWLWLGFYFSLVSAFNIGWRDLNVGSWISRIHPGEYTLRATGWVKVVSGFQSLISVYLLAIWALTYFGRPFD